MMFIVGGSAGAGAAAAAAAAAGAGAAVDSCWYGRLLTKSGARREREPGRDPGKRGNGLVNSTDPPLLQVGTTETRVMINA